MFIAFDVGETLVEYQGLALDWSAHYRPALEHALAAASVRGDEAGLSAAVDILSFYNTRRNPRTFEVNSGEVTAKLARLFDLAPSLFECGFFAYFQRRSRPLPGAAQLLRDLRDAGHYLAALSDVPYGMPTAMLVSDLGELAASLDVVVSSCDVGVRKPASRGLRQLLVASGCSPMPAYYVGNEGKDIAAALGAGMRSILLAPAGDAPDYGQTHTVSSLAEVASIVLQKPGAAPTYRRQV